MLAAALAQTCRINASVTGLQHLARFASDAAGGPTSVADQMIQYAMQQVKVGQRKQTRFLLHARRRSTCPRGREMCSRLVGSDLMQRPSRLSASRNFGTIIAAGWPARPSFRCTYVRPVSAPLHDRGRLCQVHVSGTLYAYLSACLFVCI
jgi:hypothetical protein